MSDINKELQDQIIRLEWDMFTKTQNAGGQASCQNNRPVFEVMRRAQMSVWGEDHLKCWLKDLKQADSQGRNLMAEKYGYMMEYTFPDEYELIRHQLPPVSDEILMLAEEITMISMHFEQKVAELYPVYTSKGRPLYQYQAAPGVASVEIYLRCELYTNSIPTLEVYLKELKEATDNPILAVHEETVKGYGYKSLADYTFAPFRKGEKL